MISGKIIKGYGRGSSLLGFPTANIDTNTNMKHGVYYGWCKLDYEEKYNMMVMSIGDNPYFNNKETSIEVHILKEYEKDFYGSQIDIKVEGYIRDMNIKFKNMDELIERIKLDIEIAKEKLQ